jgi:hypothetical protein
VHTANSAVIAYAEALESDAGRIGTAESLGLDEVAFSKLGPRRHLESATSIVDTGTALLLDLALGRPVTRRDAGSRSLGRKSRSIPRLSVPSEPCCA